MRNRFIAALACAIGLFVAPTIALPQVIGNGATPGGVQGNGAYTPSATQQNWGAGLTVTSTSNAHSNPPDGGDSICVGDFTVSNEIGFAFGSDATDGNAIYPGLAVGLQGALPTTGGNSKVLYSTEPPYDYATYHDQPSCVSLGAGMFLIPFYAGEMASWNTGSSPAMPSGWYFPHGQAIANGGAQPSFLVSPTASSTNGAKTLSGLSSSTPIINIPTVGLSEINAATLGSLTLVVGNAQEDSADQPNNSAMGMAIHRVDSNNLWFESNAAEVGGLCTYTPDCYSLTGLNTTTFAGGNIGSASPGEMVLSVTPMSNMWGTIQITSGTVTAGAMAITIGSNTCTVTLSGSHTAAAAATAIASGFNTNSGGCASARQSATSGPGIHKAVATASGSTWGTGTIGMEDNPCSSGCGAGSVAFPANDSTTFSVSCTAPLTCASGTVDVVSDEGFGFRLVSPVVQAQNSCFILGLTVDNVTTSYLQSAYTGNAFSLHAMKTCPSQSVINGGSLTTGTNPSVNSGPAVWTWTDLAGNNSYTNTPMHGSGAARHQFSDPIGSNVSTLNTTTDPYLWPNALSANQTTGTVPFASDYSIESDQATTSPIIGGSQHIRQLPNGDYIAVFGCRATAADLHLCYSTLTPGSAHSNQQDFIDGASGTGNTSYWIGSNVQVGPSGKVYVMAAVGDGTDTRFGCPNAACILVYSATPPAAGSTAKWSWTKTVLASWSAGGDGSPGVVYASPDGIHLIGAVRTANISATEGAWAISTYDYVCY